MCRAPRTKAANGREAWVKHVAVGGREASVAATVAEWIPDGVCTLMALDAPLGWPTGLSQALHSHQAGAPVQIKPNWMFRRETDREVRRVIGKQPLDVGADRIARTAHAALTLLDALRQRTGEAIPLAWKSSTAVGTSAIEVYPAATLVAHGISVAGYKQKDGQAARRRLLGLLQERITIRCDTVPLESNDDALDAVICVLAGVDFLRGEAIEPTDIETAKREGWIWVRKPGA